MCAFRDAMTQRRASFRATRDHPVDDESELMMGSRRQKLEALLVETPDDVTLRYMLAMEFASEGDHDQSLRRLDELADNDPPYVPAFFMASQQLAEQNRIDEARARLRAGIDEARRQGDGHAAAEMSEFLETLGVR